MTRGLFGREGDPPTDFEVALLARCEDQDDRWVALGKRIGAAALFAVLEELGGLGTLSAPRRATFVMRLYRPVRDAEILALERAGVDRSEIGRTYGITRQSVDEAVLRALRQPAGEAGRKRA